MKIDFYSKKGILSFLMVFLIIRSHNINTIFNQGMYASNEVGYAMAARECDGVGLVECAKINGENLPLLIWLTYFMYLIFGISELTGRIIPLICSISSLVLMYLIGKEIGGKKIGFISMILLGFSPMHIHISDILLPDMPMFAFNMLGCYFFIKFYKNDNRKYLFFGGIATIIAGLFKVVGIYPIGILLFYSLVKKGNVKKKDLSLLILSAFLVVLLTLTFGPDFSCDSHIRQNIFCHFGQGYQLNPEFYLRLFNRLNYSIPLWIFGLIFIILNKKINFNFMFFWFVLIFGFLMISGEGTYIHPYYVLPWLPVWCIIISKGLLNKKVITVLKKDLFVFILFYLFSSMVFCYNSSFNTNSAEDFDLEDLLCKLNINDISKTCQNLRLFSMDDQILFTLFPENYKSPNFKEAGRIIKNVSNGFPILINKEFAFYSRNNLSNVYFLENKKDVLDFIDNKTNITLITYTHLPLYVMDLEDKIMNKINNEYLLFKDMAVAKIYLKR